MSEQAPSQADDPHTAVTAICWAGVVFFALGLICALLAGLGWPFEIPASLLPQIAAAGVVMTLGALVLRRWAAAAAALALAAASGWGAREMFLPPAPPVAEADLRILWANLFHRQDALEKVLALAEAEEADLVVLAEMPAGFTKDHGPGGEYAYFAGRPEMERVNVAVFSKTPLVGVEPLAGSAEDRRKGVRFIVETEGGSAVVAAIHPAIPIAGRLQRERDATVREALDVPLSTPTVIVGDFNATPWTPLLRGAAREGAVTRAPLGLRSTWMARFPVLGLPIDHAYAGGGAKISARLGTFVGSDHRPLIVDVALPDGDPPAPAEERAMP